MVLDRFFRYVGEVMAGIGAVLSERWGPSQARAWSYWALWISISVTVLFNIIDVFNRWAAIGDNTAAPEGVFAALGMYPIGGRIVAAILFLALFVWMGTRSKGWLLTLSTAYVISRFVDLDAIILDSLESRDTLLLAQAAEVGEFLPLFIAVWGYATLAIFALVLVLEFVNSRTYKNFRSRVRGDFARLRISEIILWSLVLTQTLLLLLAWVFLWVEGDAFPVMFTYPVLGRLIAFAAFALLLAFSIRSRGFLLTLAVGSYLVGRLGIDSMLVDLFEQPDRFLRALYSSANLDLVAQLLDIIGLVVPILLVWITVLSIARAVRVRARERINTWIDSRRIAIYGAEDHGADVPTRVSVLAVFSLITSIVLPILGLVLAYAARNDFVAAKPRKSGVDLAVAATIIGWFGLGVQLLFVIVAFVGGLMGGPEPLELLFGLFSAVFGGSAISPFANEFFGDALLSVLS